ncbi:MAG: hypothetical protein IPK32_26315 [Verrucomicrobiaceae bacterium]|nr:hypothetical protein [Verrucomicrobiaceae bacterium]
MRIYKTYGAEAQAILKENPYRLAQDIRGIGFKTADDIAYQLGVAADAPQRIKAAILHVLETAAQSGHCCFPEAKLAEKPSRCSRRMRSSHRRSRPSSPKAKSSVMATFYTFQAPRH